MKVKMSVYDYATADDIKTARRTVSLQVDDDTLVVYLREPKGKDPVIFAKSLERYPFSDEMLDALRNAELVFEEED